MRRDDPILEMLGYGLPYWIEDTAASCVFNTCSINPCNIHATRITYVLYRPRALNNVDQAICLLLGQLATKMVRS